MRRKLLGWFLLVAWILGACAQPGGAPPVQGTPAPATTLASPAGWQTYQNEKHGFSLEAPAGWLVLETPTEDYLTSQEEVWLAAESLPPSQTGARADIVLMILDRDPALDWTPEKFDDYHSEALQIAGQPALRISGRNKETLGKDIAVIVPLGERFLLALPNGSPDSLKYFDAVIASLKFFSLHAAATPASSPVATLPPASPTAAPANPVVEIAITPIPGADCGLVFFDPVAFLPDNTHLLGRTHTGVRIFNTETRVEESLVERSQPVIAASLSPDGSILALALEDHRIELVSIADGQTLHVLKGHTGPIMALKWSPAGDRLFSGSLDTWVHEWDLDGNEVYAFQPGGVDFPSPVVALGVSPTGKTLATQAEEGPTRLWDHFSHQKIAEYEGSISGGYAGSEIVFSSDSRYLAAGLGSGGLTSVWDLSSGQLVWRGGLFGVAFSPDGTLLATTEIDESGNQVVVLRSADGQRSLHTLTGHASLPWRVVFSPNGKRLASADNSETRLWDPHSGELLLVRHTKCGMN